MKKLIIILFILAIHPLVAQELDQQTDNKKVKKKALKFEFFAPLTGNFTVAFEQYTGKGISWEGKLGFIGMGKNIEDQKGIFVKIGPKFKLVPDYITDDLRSSHPLRGSYIKPEFMMSYFQHNELFLDFTGETSKLEKLASAVLINFGKQYVLANKFTIDWSIGVGYGFTTNNSGGYLYGAAGGDNNFPLVISSGFTLGILL